MVKRIKSKLKTEDIIKRLRQPAQYGKQSAAAQNTQAQQTPDTEASAKKRGWLGRMRKEDLPMWIISGVCGVLVLISFGFFLTAKNRAEDLAAALDPSQLEGLKIEQDEFNPHATVTYVQIREGQDRNVAVENLGSTLPIISRFNLKNFTAKNYQIVGAAPWALTTNFSSNKNDPGLMRMLLDNEEMIQAFLARPDVEPLLEDPKLLLAFAQDEDSLAEFFNSETVQQVLNNEMMLRTTAGSRFMGHLLISKSGKYFRDHPQEALAVIDASPTLNALRANPAVQVAVKENPKLAPLADQLLKPTRMAPVAPVEKPMEKQVNKKAKKTKRKK